MFVLTLLADTIRIPPHLLAQPTLTSVQAEIEKRYPNKIIVDVGLVLCPYGPPLEVGDGILAPGDGGAHHQVVFQCVVFRPFVDEVLIGTVTESREGGVMVRVGGFFDHVFIPAYWMLNPSVYDESTGLWVWTPTYDDDDDEEEEEGEKEGDEIGIGIVKEEPNMEEEAAATVTPIDLASSVEGDEAEGGEEQENRFEIEIGSEIRFKVKAVNFTRITTTMKGVQATTTSTATTSSKTANSSSSKPPSTESNGEKSKNGNSKEEEGGGAVRRRSSSADLSDEADHPAPMQIVGSICEDGLGLTSWWKTAEEEEGEEEEDDEEDGFAGEEE